MGFLLCLRALSGKSIDLLACLVTVIVNIALGVPFLFLWHASDSAQDLSGHFSF